MVAAMRGKQVAPAYLSLHPGAIDAAMVGHAIMRAGLRAMSTISGDKKLSL
jgi:hypothetical protein